MYVESLLATSKGFSLANQLAQRNLQRLCHAEQGIEGGFSETSLDERNHRERETGFLRQRIHRNTLLCALLTQCIDNKGRDLIA